MDIDQLIQQRRTVKPEKYADTPVEDHLIEAMLENANWAPTHGFTEPWRFWVFKGDGRHKLAKFHANLYKAETPSDAFKSSAYQKLHDRPLLASHVIAIGMKRGTNPKIPEIEEVEATACAVQNMMKAFFGLEEADKILGFLYAGYPSYQWPKGKRISNIASKTQWVTNNQ